MKETNSLKIVNDLQGFNTECDGCGKLMPHDERHLSGIESCCGGCYRHLCRDCVQLAAKMIGWEQAGMPDQGSAHHQEVLDTMERYGGSFAKELADAWRKADGFNHERLCAGFGHLYLQYTEMLEQVKASSAPVARHEHGKWSVKALWYQPDVGLEGAIFALMEDDSVKKVCSKEKWDMGRRDSLRRGWTGDVRIGTKTFYQDVDPSERTDDGAVMPDAVKALMKNGGAS